MSELAMDRTFYGPLSQKVAAWKREYTPGPLTEDEYNRFFEDGFLVKHNLLQQDQLDSVIKSIEECVDELAQKLFQAGKIQDLYKHEGFYQRLTSMNKDFPGASVVLHKRGILPQTIADLWSSEVLLKIAKQLLGSDDVAGHPVWNLRPKVPDQEQTTVPWHQDAAYLNNECWHVLQVTAWIPLIDANHENGCLQVLCGGHRSGIVGTHNCCTGNTWYIEIPTEEMENRLGIPVNERSVATCEVPFGSVLLLNNLIPHRSTQNYSQNIRWSLDLRWQRPNEPNGFYGLKENIIMSKKNDENYKPDWKVWANINRTLLQEDAVKESILNEVPELRDKVENDPFDTTVSGPWMANWPLVHHNKHTASLRSSTTDWNSP